MNFSRFCAIGCFFFFLLLTPASSLAATVHGTVYEWYSFEPLNNAVVEVNSTPEQYLVATDATYSFNLSSGTYLITASYFEDGVQVYSGEEIVEVSGEGDYVLDLLLFPTDSAELLDQSEFEEPGQDFETSAPVEETGSQNTTAVFILFILSVLLLLGYFWKKRQKALSSKDFSLKVRTPLEVEVESEKSVQKEERKGTGEEIRTENGIKKGAGTGTGTETETEEIIEAEEAEKEREKPRVIQPETPEAKPLKKQDTKLPEDLTELLELIRANGNRITQRELRKKSKYSESKVSLMLSDLEERGLIEKFKKGRGNIIRISDDQIQKQAESEKKN